MTLDTSFTALVTERYRYFNRYFFTHDVTNFLLCDITFVFPFYSTVVSPENIRIPGNQTVNENDTILLNCGADGNPAPNIIWTRVSGGRVVTMPFTISGKQDEGFYRCTADNGIKHAAIGEVFITVQSKCIGTIDDKHNVKKNITAEN